MLWAEYLSPMIWQVQKIIQMDSIRMWKTTMKYYELRLGVHNCIFAFLFEVSMVSFWSKKYRKSSFEQRWLVLKWFIDQRYLLEKERRIGNAPNSWTISNVYKIINFDDSGIRALRFMRLYLVLEIHCISVKNLFSSLLSIHIAVQVPVKPENSA